MRPLAIPAPQIANTGNRFYAAIHACGLQDLGGPWRVRDGRRARRHSCLRHSGLDLVLEYPEHRQAENQPVDRPGAERKAPA